MQIAVLSDMSSAVTTFTLRPDFEGMRSYGKENFSDVTTSIDCATGDNVDVLWSYNSYTFV